MVEALQSRGASDIQVAGLQILTQFSFLWDFTISLLSGFEVDTKVFDSTGGIVSLPDDQWVREIVRLEGMIWAALQTLTSDYAIGFSVQAPALEEFVRRNLTEGKTLDKVNDSILLTIFQGEKQLCRVQRMRKPGGMV